MTVARGRRTALTRATLVASFAGLIVTQLLDSWLRQAPPIIWALRVLPLLIFLPGLLRDNLRTCVWVCFVSLMYFVTLVLRLFKDVADPVSWSGMVCVVLVFCTGMYYVRWRTREQNAAREAEGVAAEST